MKVRIEYQSGVSQILDVETLENIYPHNDSFWFGKDAIEWAEEQGYEVVNREDHIRDDGESNWDPYREVGRCIRVNCKWYPIIEVLEKDDNGSVLVYALYGVDVFGRLRAGKAHYDISWKWLEFLEVRTEKGLMNLGLEIVKEEKKDE